MGSEDEKEVGEIKKQGEKRGDRGGKGRGQKEMDGGRGKEMMKTTKLGVKTERKKRTRQQWKGEERGGK